MVAVEVKAAVTVRRKDLQGLHWFAQAAGDRFKLGILLYDGDQIMPMPTGSDQAADGPASGIWAVPISTLWGR